MQLLMRFIPLILVELCARLGGYLVNLYRPEYRYTVQRRIRGAYWAARLGTKTLKVGQNVLIESDRIQLGHNVTLYDGGQYTTGPKGRIKIGKNCHIARHSIISGAGGVEIGDGCSISSLVAIYSLGGDTNAPSIHEAKPILNPVKIGNNVYMGVGSKVIPGVTIGDGAVIAAGAVVVRDVPGSHLARGVPAECSPLTKRREE